MDKLLEGGRISSQASAFHNNDDNNNNNQNDNDDDIDSEEREQGTKPIRPETALKISLENPSNIIFKQLFELRMTQMKQGVDLSNLTRVQWGLTPIKFSHHIVIKKSLFKEIPYIFQVTVCTACSPVSVQDSCEVFLGVYGEQESALLVSDVHEILNGKYY